MAVTRDVRLMVVSHYKFITNEHALRVYHIAADYNAALLHSVGGAAGAGRLQFSRPAKICIASSGCLLECDSGNNRVQELSAPSEADCVYVP